MDLQNTPVFLRIDRLLAEGQTRSAAQLAGMVLEAGLSEAVSRAMRNREVEVLDCAGRHLRRRVGPRDLRRLTGGTLGVICTDLQLLPSALTAQLPASVATRNRSAHGSPNTPFCPREARGLAHVARTVLDQVDPDPTTWRDVVGAQRDPTVERTIEARFIEPRSTVLGGDEPGGWIRIHGEAGSGKSTLLRDRLACDPRFATGLGLRVFQVIEHHGNHLLDLVLLQLRDRLPSSLLPAELPRTPQVTRALTAALARIKPRDFDRVTLLLDLPPGPLPSAIVPLVTDIPPGLLIITAEPTLTPHPIGAPPSETVELGEYDARELADACALLGIESATTRSPLRLGWPGLQANQGLQAAVDAWLGAYDAKHQPAHREILHVLGAAKTWLPWQALTTIVRMTQGDEESEEVPEPGAPRPLPLRRRVQAGHTQYALDHDETVGVWLREDAQRTRKARHALIAWAERVLDHGTPDQESFARDHLIRLFWDDLHSEAECPECREHLALAVSSRPGRPSALLDWLSLRLDARTPAGITVGRAYRRQLRQASSALWTGALPNGTQWPTQDSWTGDPARSAVQAILGALLPLRGWPNDHRAERGARPPLADAGDSPVRNHMRSIIQGVVNDGVLDLAFQASTEAEAMSLANLLQSPTSQAQAYETAGLALASAGEWDGALRCLGRARHFFATNLDEDAVIRIDAAIPDVLLGAGLPFEEAQWSGFAERAARRAGRDPRRQAVASAGLARVAVMRKANESKGEDDRVGPWWTSIAYCAASVAVASGSPRAARRVRREIERTTKDWDDEDPRRVADELSEIVCPLYEDFLLAPVPTVDAWRALAVAHALNTLAVGVADQISWDAGQRFLDDASTLAHRAQAEGPMGPSAREITHAITINRAVAATDSNHLGCSRRRLQTTLASLASEPHGTATWCAWLTPIARLNLATVDLAEGCSEGAEAAVHAEAAWRASLLGPQCPELLQLRSYLAGVCGVTDLRHHVRARLARPQHYVYALGNAVSALLLFGEGAVATRRLGEAVRAEASSVGEHWVALGVSVNLAILAHGAGDIPLAQLELATARTILHRHYAGDEWIQARIDIASLAMGGLPPTLDAGLRSLRDDGATLYLANAARVRDGGRWLPWLFQLFAETPGFPWQEAPDDD